ncbi:hypothetical protein NC653_037581 [Populus alba x Populus x berolinensis]|uniref:Uncharacterized protein n=1 Tax=Populus alba x Populus x berolinensis TaxID=444605 RepID=A0AAD6LEP7_9ROSI|nr:hypothetical protein NC653_037581 [Populus alba x Populus x berolinensis]
MVFWYTRGCLYAIKECCDEANCLWIRVSDPGFFSRNLITNPWLSEHPSFFYHSFYTPLRFLMFFIFLGLFLWDKFAVLEKKFSLLGNWAYDDNIIILADFSELIKSMI